MSELPLKAFEFEGERIIFPDFSTFRKSNDLFMTEAVFTNYLDNFMTITTINDLMFSCFNSSQTVLDHFVHIDLANFTVSASNNLLNMTNLCSNRVNIIVLSLKVSFVNSKAAYDTVGVNMNDPGLLDIDAFDVFEFSEQIDPYKLRSAHSNVLIIDNVSKQIELFEPHGEIFMHPISQTIKAEGVIKKAIKRLLPFVQTYKFKNLASVCMIGPQSLQNAFNPRAGHCLAWSLLFIVVRVLNSRSSSPQNSERIYSFLTKMSSKNLDSIIRRFITFCQALPQSPQVYTNETKLSATYLTSKGDLARIERRLQYLLYTYLQKLRNGSKSDIELLFEEIISYRQFPAFHSLFNASLFKLAIDNSDTYVNNKMEVEKLLNEIL
jgi:hypothetical protein